MRFLVVVVMILAAIEIAAADTKKSSTADTKKSSTKSIEINDFSFGASNPSSMNAKRQGSAPSPVGSAGKSGSKH
jgi:hypothetical protein